MSPTLDNLFVLSPEHKGGKRVSHEIKDYRIAEFLEQTPTGLLQQHILQEKALFVPGIVNAQETLFWILSQDKIKDSLQAYGAVRIFRDKNKEILWLSLPNDKVAQKYLYYTALFETLHAQELLHSKDKEKEKEKSKHKDKDKGKDKEEKEKEKAKPKEHTFLQVEKKLSYIAEHNQENFAEFVHVRMGLLTGLLQSQEHHDSEYAKQILETLTWLKSR